ncbi:H-type small acid-soluble spore protein [Calidifontibacillus oryziterrae]|uniref:H-type small acid-soluble spore protein n=1 Tax=Calidifontibacillus oryziterrae TaxID=1191699 RepID=UPI0002E8AC28|nr:H-type small acid-soluble spore protein [Calidifontibacillus oryziterrae]
MDIKRAKQIITSPNEVTVKYNGVSVWLKHTNETDQSVSVFMKDNPDDVMIVPVAELEEK